MTIEPRGTSTTLIAAMRRIANEAGSIPQGDLALWVIDIADRAIAATTETSKEEEIVLSYEPLAGPIVYDLAKALRDGKPYGDSE